LLENSRILAYMAYLSTAIANDFLDLAERDRRPISQMQVQKLIYFAHGWHLALHDKPLSMERFEAWDYGPVVRRLWEHLRKFGSKAVTERVSDFAMVGGKFKTVVSRISDSSNTGDRAVATDIIRTVWDKYGHFSAIQLSELTHIPEGPWAGARRSGQSYIDDHDIERYFKSLKAG